MILGVGIDIIEVDRVAEKLAKNNGFREKVFSRDEIAFCSADGRSSENYAARFAAKEAFFKALGTGWLNGTAFNEVEIAKDEKGKPFIRFLGETLTTIESFGFGRISVSMAHLNSIASATVIIEL